MLETAVRRTLVAVSWLGLTLGLVVPVSFDPTLHTTVSALQILRLRDSVYGREHLAVLAPSIARTPTLTATPRLIPLLLPWFEGDDLVRSLRAGGAAQPSDAQPWFPDLGRAAMLLSRRPLLEQAIALRRMTQERGGAESALSNADIARLPGESAFAAIYAFLIRCGLTPRIAVISGASARGAVRQASMGMLTDPAPTSARLGSDAGLSARLLCVDSSERPLSITLDPVDAISISAVGRGICALQVETGLLNLRGVARGSLPPSECLGEWSFGPCGRATDGRP
jgi:hypothetical protein